MAAREVTLISGQRPNAAAAAAEPVAAPATATSCNVADEQAVDIRSSEQQETNNNQQQLAQLELKKANKNTESSYVSKKEQNVLAGNSERLSPESRNERTSGEKQNVSDKPENGTENDGYLTSSLKSANLAQSSRDKNGDRLAEIANDIATKTGDKTIPNETGTNSSGKKSTQQQHTIIECGRNKQTSSSNEQMSNTTNCPQDSAENCVSLAPIQTDHIVNDENIKKVRTTLEDSESSETINQASLIKNNNNIDNSNSVISNNNKQTFVQKHKIHGYPEEVETEEFPNKPSSLSSSNLNHNTFGATKLEPEQEFGCKKRRLSYLQSLLLRKWPCLAIAICIMSSLLFGMLLSALTVYLMHGVTDCSSFALAATRVNHHHPLMGSQHERPSDFGVDTPIELASLTGHELNTSGSRLYASGLTSRSNASSSEPNAPTAQSHKFRRLPGTLWPIHYDLFVQPYIFEPHFNFTGKVSTKTKTKTAIQYNLNVKKLNFIDNN